MKKSIPAALVLLLALLVPRGFGQINQMNRPANSAPSVPAPLPVPAGLKPGAADITLSTVKNQASIARLFQGVPVPKKVLLLSYNPQLALRSVNTLTAQVATALGQGQGSRIVEAGIVGVHTKTYRDTHKVSYVLTTQTGGWSASPLYVTRQTVTAPVSMPPWTCTTKVESVNAQSTSFMNASKDELGQHLYPGAIYAFEDYALGNFRPYESGLNAMDIYTTMQTGTNSLTVPTPNNGTIHQAIATIIGQFGGNAGGASVVQQTLYPNNEAERAIATSAGGAYDGYTGSDWFSSNPSEHHIYIILDVIKSLYTISARRPANGFFVSGQIPSAPSTLVMVQDVTYGARILVGIDVTLTAKTDLKKLQLSTSAIAANGSFNVDALAQDATITYKLNTYIAGVPTSTGVITTLQNFSNQLDRILAQSNYRNAVPVQYSLADMDGRLLGVESMTDKFSFSICTPTGATH